MAKMFAVADDPNLPALPRLIDPQFMKQLFIDRLHNVDHRRWVIERVRVVEMRYRPGRRCEMIYRVRYASRSGSGWDKQFFSAIVLPPNAARLRFDQVRHQTYIKPEFGPAVQFFEELGLIIWGFPNDPKLPSLQQFLQPDFLQTYIQQRLDAFGLPGETELQSLKTQVVKYVPQDRCTLKHELNWRANGQEGGLIFFSKLFNPKFDGAGSYRVLSALSRSRVVQEGTLLFPQPILHDSQRNVIFQHALQGQHVPDDFSGCDVADLAKRCGKALAGFQQTELPLTNVLSRRGMLLEVAESIQSVGKRQPVLLSKLLRLQKGLEDTLPGLTALPNVTNHGAFRITQMLRVDQQLGLVDFDGVLLSDPMLDAGSFIAHLLYQAVKNELTIKESRLAIEAFCHGYREAAPWGMPSDVLRWFTIALLISKHAKKCIRLAKKQQNIRVERLVEIATAIWEEKLDLQTEMPVT